MTHRVQASRQGEAALLRCSICRSSALVTEADFEAINRFVAEHKLCLDASR